MALEIPEIVIEYVRNAFKNANDAVSAAQTHQPAIHEESLDHILIAELSATPPTFFAAERAAVAVETHWLGGRRMYGRWEIADIALFVILRRAGKLDVRKTALLQTKRLYSKEIPTVELEDFDYKVGIGRIADKTDTIFPISRQRTFSFDSECVFGAMSAGSPQVTRIDNYTAEKDIPVYYGLYCPLNIPYQGLYPRTSSENLSLENTYGCRVRNATDIHRLLGSVVAGKAPSLEELHEESAEECIGWTLENFIADEVLRCREGKLFEDADDENLSGLLYGRSAPITAAISISIDLAPDRKAG